jgi:hypothetical protein
VSTVPSSTPEPSPDRRPARQRVGFLAHQAVEYVLGAALVVSGVHVAGAVQLLLIGLGVVLILLSAFTRGPLGAARLIGRRLHHVLDLVVVGVLAISPLASLHHPNVGAIAVAESVAVLLVRIERGTNYGVAAPPARAALSVPAGAVPATALPPSRPALGGMGAKPAPLDPVATRAPAQAAAAAQAAAPPSAARPGVPTQPASAARPDVPVQPTAAARPAAADLAAVARSGAAVASAAAAQLAPVAAKAARRGAFQLGVLTAAARRAARQASAPAPPPAGPASDQPRGPSQG